MSRYRYNDDLLHVRVSDVSRLYKCMYYITDFWNVHLEIRTLSATSNTDLLKDKTFSKLNPALSCHTCKIWGVLFTLLIVLNISLALKQFSTEFSKTSIARARIAWIPDRSNTLADSMFRFFAIFNSYYCFGGYFYKPESPEVQI